MTDFDTLGLVPALTKALGEAGIDRPTPIQAQAIPLALDGNDVLGLAQTGTGKTLAFGLPMVQRLIEAPGKPEPKSVKALILAPTRELVNQIADNLRPLVAGTKVRIVTVVGGQSINRQIRSMERGTDVMIATPGRLIDLMERGSVQLGTVKALVLDEADQMLDMGFIHALRRIAPALGTPRQTMLFSATMPKQMESLARDYLKNPRRIEVAPPGKTADKVTQSVEFMPKAEKAIRLRDILDDNTDAQSLVFLRTKHGAERLKKQLEADGYAAVSIHGNKSQGQRDRAIQAFRAGDASVLVATDVAARGIDIPEVALVVNYDLPNVPEVYVHRIGRTARAGRDGASISFCAPDEQGLLRDIEKLIGRRFGGDRPAPEPEAEAPRKQGGKPGPKKNKRRRRKPGQGQPQGQAQGHSQGQKQNAAPKGQGARKNARGRKPRKLSHAAA